MTTFEQGDGATYHLFTDAQAGTIVEAGPKRVVWQRDRATRTNREADTFEPGGFVGHTECPYGQDWSYEPDPDGPTLVFTRRGNGQWVKRGHDLRSPGLRLLPGRHEHYDYNF